MVKNLSETKYATQKMEYFPYLHSDCFQTWHKSNLSSPPTIKTILSEIPALVQKLLSLRFEKLWSKTSLRPPQMDLCHLLKK